MAVTLAELRQQVRERTEQESSDFITDSELNSYINNSIAELHDIMIQAYGSEYFLSPAYEFSTVSNQQSYSLPTDLYKLRGVDVKLSTQEWNNVEKFNFNERNKIDYFGAWSSLGFTNVRYRMMGVNILFSPIPDNATNVRLWYVPVSTKLEADDDELVDYNAWSEYVVVDAAIKIFQKEESDPSVFMQQKVDLKRRIEEVANNRDISNSESVSDVYADNDDDYWRFRG